MKLCFLDLETTGFDPHKDSIIEISFIIREGEAVTTTFDRVVTPDKSLLSPEVTSITGITQSELDTHGVPFTQLQAEVNTLLTDCVIVGHNINFDLQFLRANGVPLTDAHYLDTHQLARILLLEEPSYSLEALSQRYGFTHTAAHRALSDVHASAQLYDHLLAILPTLPAEFFRQLQQLSTPHHWFAWSLFVGQSGQSDIPPYQSPTLSLPTDLPPAPPALLRALTTTAGTPAPAILTPQTQQAVTVPQWLALAQALAAQGQPVAIVSPHLDFWAGVPLIPTPEVLLDPQRLLAWPAQHTSLSDDQLCFYLQCLHRHLRGYRGQHYFGLYMHQRQWWSEICQTDIDTPEFQALLTTKASLDIVALSSRAFWRLRGTSVLAGRTLLIDEGELFAQHLLHQPEHRFDLSPLMDDPTTSTAAQFWVSGFVRDVIETQLGHAVGHFPAKVALPAGRAYTAEAKALKAIDPTAVVWARQLAEPDPGTHRWAEFHPRFGRLTLHRWAQSDWLALQHELTQWPRLIGYRHAVDRSFSFWRVLVGAADYQVIVPEGYQQPFPFTLTPNPESTKSPTFNAYVAQQVREHHAQLPPTESLLVYASSLETIRKVVLDLESTPSTHPSATIIAEGLKGGKGKLLLKLQETERPLLFVRSLCRPALAQTPCTTAIVPKFPFAAPHPLYDALGDDLKFQGGSWFTLWALPQVAASLGRMLGQFPNLQTVHLLDGRANARWGRDLLRLYAHLVPVTP